MCPSNTCGSFFSQKIQLNLQTMGYIIYSPPPLNYVPQSESGKSRSADMSIGKREPGVGSRCILRKCVQ